ncbi:MAG: hypothetical protein C5B50_08950 [Verrucomicrobia bacterium]|nr:MAG: hypothetical protein C5B50_08950 [Verrucomicrobiota bacterium]
MSPAKSSFIPTPGLACDWFQRRRYRRIQAQEEKGAAHQWFLLCGPAAPEARLKPEPGRLRQILPPEDRAWADPFLWKRGDDFYIFCEEWVFGQPHAHIAAFKVSAGGQPMSESVPVLKESYHLSYPFLFEHEGALYMLPEAGAGRTLAAYQCEEFPHRWRKRALLMQNIRFADATLIEHQEKWWLFMTLNRRLFALNRDLFVFWAESPLAQNWRPHPHNPVVRDIQSARPAGSIFELGGKLYRPSQNCLIRYGYSLRINEILRLDTQGYQEVPVTEVRPDAASGLRAHHHLDWRDGLMVMDSQRLLSASGVNR